MDLFDKGTVNLDLDPLWAGVYTFLCLQHVDYSKMEKTKSLAERSDVSKIILYNTHLNILAYTDTDIETGKKTHSNIQILPIH